MRIKRKFMLAVERWRFRSKLRLELAQCCSSQHFERIENDIGAPEYFFNKESKKKAWEK